MRVLVTGGAGFIGSRLVGALCDRGDEVSVLDDLSGGSLDALPAAARLITADIADPPTVGSIADVRSDVIVHAAAQVSVTRSVDEPERDAAVNIEGTRHVMAGATAAGTRRVVFLSSGGAIYGEADGADESTPPAPESPYGRSKLAAERIVAETSASYAIARLANVYGPGQRADLEGGVVAIFVERLLAGDALDIHGTGEQTRDLVHVDDVVAALVAMIDHEASGTWNVGTGVATSVLELAERVQHVVGAEARYTWLPRRPGDVMTSRLDVRRIATDLGWRAEKDLEAGLRATLAEHPLTPEWPVAPEVLR